LDIKNPRAKEDFAHMPPKILVQGILEKEQKVIRLIQDVNELL